MPKPLRLAFMGTPLFAVAALDALVEAGHDIVAVYTQPPRAAGRGKALTPTPVHRYAQERGLTVHTPLTLKNAEEQAAFAALDLDIAVVVAYGLLLPDAILAAPRRGCLNIHASLLPRWRGAAPIQRAIAAGDTVTGINIMQMEAGLDTGPVLLEGQESIRPNDTSATLHDRLAPIGARLIVDALARLDQLTPQPQSTTGMTYAKKITKAESRLDFTQPAQQLERQIRALHPNTFLLYREERLLIHAAQVVDGEGPPGLTLDDRLTIATGHQALRPTLVQRAGRSPMATADFLRGTPIPAHTQLL